MRKVVFLQSSLTDVYRSIYRQFPNCKYVGIYHMDRPGILIRDPDIIEDVLVKNFSNFHDNDLEIKIEHDPIFGNNPFVLKGDMWKKKRIQHLSSVTPAKVKAMYPEIDACGDRMVSYLNKKIEKTGIFCMEALELAARYTTDTCTAVGVNLDANSFTDGVPELREAGRDIFEVGLFRSLKLYFMFLLPTISSFVTLRLLPKSLTQKYKSLVVQTLKYRAENNIKKNDFFDHLQEFRGEKQTVDEMAAQLGGLYIDGFGTNASGINFLIYNIAALPDVQNRLRDEIREYLERNDGKLTPEAIIEMPYLDAVVSESLRQYPPFPNLTRRCTKSYEMPKASENSSGFTMKVGTPVVIPAYTLHHDERFFPNPEKFDPDRFLGSNKESIVKYSYIPFGEGPRICIGMRFALFQTKVSIIKLVQNFKLSVNYDKTKLPIRIHPQGLILAAMDKLWINFEKLN
ncbi:Cytochrome P450 [Popillia japonica]|uniref:Cytochrome P450 n=1 Tax=Popillia japonica TaxID=7064 RepID=A0AAW1MFZ9_POPJA